MQVSDMRFLFDYHFWATEQVYAKAEQLGSEQFTDASSGESIRDRLVHALSVEDAWLSGWEGNQHMPNLEAADFPTVAELRTLNEAQKTKLYAFLDRLSDEALEQPYYIFPKLWQVMTHVAYHAMQHRSEAALLLSQHGASPGGLDMMLFIKPNAHEEHAAQSSAS